MVNFHNTAACLHRQAPRTISSANVEIIWHNKMLSGKKGPATIHLSLKSWLVWFAGCEMFQSLAHCCLFALQPLPRTGIIYSLESWEMSRRTADEMIDMCIKRQEALHLMWRQSVVSMLIYHNLNKKKSENCWWTPVWGHYLFSTVLIQKEPHGPKENSQTYASHI